MCSEFQVTDFIHYLKTEPICSYGWATHTFQTLFFLAIAIFVQITSYMLARDIKQILQSTSTVEI